jgi:heptosyltransferase-3
MKIEFDEIVSKQPFKILVFRNGDIGNTVVSEPFFREFKRLFPKSIIHAVFDVIGSELMSDDPHIDFIYTFNKNKDSLSRKIELIKLWRKNNYLFSFHLKSGITNELLAFLSGIKYRIGFPLKGSFQFVNHKVIKSNQIKHHVDNGNYLLSIFNQPLESCTPKLYSSENSEKLINDFLLSKALVESKYIVLHPAGKTMKKNNWSVSYYSNLIKFLEREYHLPIIIIGIPPELNDVKSILGKNENMIYYFEDNIKIKSELIRKAKFFLGNDSGPFHIAECWQVPSVVLYKENNDNYKRWHPLNKEKSQPLFISELENEEKVFSRITKFFAQWEN